MPKTSVYLPADLAAAVKESGESLGALIRLGLAVKDGGIPPVPAMRDGGIPLTPPMPTMTVYAVHGLDDWITVQQAADVLGITESRVHHLISQGWLYSRKDDWRRLVLTESVSRELTRRSAIARPPYPAPDASSTADREPVSSSAG